jgi:hypothetical protein
VVFTLVSLVDAIVVVLELFICRVGSLRNSHPVALAGLFARVVHDSLECKTLMVRTIGENGFL